MAPRLQGLGAFLSKGSEMAYSATVKLDKTREFHLTMLGLKYIDKKYGSLSAALKELTYTLTFQVPKMKAPDAPGAEPKQEKDAEGNPVFTESSTESYRTAVVADFIFAGILHNPDAHTTVGDEIVPNFAVKTAMEAAVGIEEFRKLGDLIYAAINGNLPDTEASTADADPTP
jgi:hypothetical protein